MVLWGGWPFFERAWASVRRMSLNMFTLIGLGTGIAYAYSAAGDGGAGNLSGRVPSGHDGKPNVYFEAAAVITTLVLLGQVLELRARGRTSGAIRALMGLAPKTARRLSARRHRGRRAPRRPSAPATASASGPANASPPTAPSSKAQRRSTSR